MAISSQFYKDLSKVEKKVWGISARQLKAMGCFLLVVAVLVSEVFLLDGWTFYFVSLLTSFVLGAYPTCLLLNKWTWVRRQIELFFYYERRGFSTRKRKRVSVDGFHQDGTTEFKEEREESSQSN